MKTLFAKAAIITTLAALAGCNEQKQALPDKMAEAKAELEEAAKTGKRGDGKHFVFGLTGDVMDGECAGDACGWQATSKEQLGNCPANSKWAMGREEGCLWNIVPKNCEAITPPAISSNTGCKDV
jgi:predicted small lipoprotein YifL